MAARGKAFPIRGYYTIMSRTQAWGLDEWKKYVDCMHDDGCNFMILWMGGGFPSRKYPETWQYNKDNRNVQENFAGKVIDYAHEKGIEVVLGFTPHAYDGVNQFGLAHPDFAAKREDGTVTPVLGIHSMGRMLCPSRRAVQEFMLGYIGEMFFDFYPNADGLFYEYSDYGHCECLACHGHYFEREWEFVREMSESIWAVKPGARMVIYPQYYQNGVSQPDERFSLFFTPHSTEQTPDVMSINCDKMYWQMSFGEPLQNMRIAARTAADSEMNGFIGSMEAFSHMGTVNGKELMFEPYDVPWVRDGAFAFDDLVPRVLRASFKILTEDPRMDDKSFVEAIGRRLRGGKSAQESAKDLLAFFEMIQKDYRDFALRNALVHPEDFERIYPEDNRAEAETRLKKDLRKVRKIAETYSGKRGDAGELGRIASWIVERWQETRP